jgi:bifunctional non-homologous end joining protein LigD
VTLPEFVEPQLAKLVKEAPEGDAWLHELKFDGYRILARLDGGHVRLLSRRGHDWTAQFPAVTAAVARLKAKTALLDGEVAIVLPDGRTSFQALQNAFGQRREDLTYFVFDLLHLDGEDVTPRPLEERKARLAELVARSKIDAIKYSDHVEGRGGEFFRTACARGLDGIISKRRDLPYDPGRRGGWVKTKCVQRQELVVGGFTDPEGSRIGIGALLCGYFEGGRLVYAGKVGTGYTNKSAKELREKLEPHEIAKPAFADPPRMPRAHWVTPKLVAEVEFTEWTGDGKIRHPSFKGLRKDKRPADVRREVAEAAPDEKPVIAGIPISSADRVMFPAAGITKLELCRYLEAVAPWMVPQVAGRPLTLVWCPQGVAGECRYMRHSKVWGPQALRRVTIQEKTKVGEYLVADDVAGLVALGQLDLVEIHTWNTRTEHLELPDRVVLDLDPGPDVAWKDVVATARLVRDAFAALHLETFVKTTGGSGLHIVVPLVPTDDFDVAAALAFSRAFAETLEREHPKLLTTANPKAGRERKILLDYLRNNRTNTSIAAYSPRAKPDAPVSVPIAWDELTTRLRSDAFTIPTVLRRLRAGTDPWARYASVKQTINAAAPARKPPAASRSGRGRAGTTTPRARPSRKPKAPGSRRDSRRSSSPS